MEGAQIHSIFIHFPMVISLVAVFIIGFGLWKNERTLIKAGLWLNVAILVFSLLMYFSGNETEISVMGMQQVDLNYLDYHKNFARITFAFSILQAIVAVANVFYFNERYSKSLSKIALVITCLSFALFSITAHYGARVSHPQLRMLDKKFLEKQRDS